MRGAGGLHGVGLHLFHGGEQLLQQGREGRAIGQLVAIEVLAGAALRGPLRLCARGFFNLLGWR
jgi:hypothetical protein